MLDPWWNPAAEQQAVDRAHRIGQTRPVMVYRLVAKDTIEEKVMALKERKSALFDAVLGGDSLSSTTFGADEIRELLGLEHPSADRSGRCPVDDIDDVRFMPWPIADNCRFRVDRGTVGWLFFCRAQC